MRAGKHLAPILAAAFLAPAAALSQAEVSALARDSDPLDSTEELRLSRFADFSEETSVAVGARLEIGDLLTSIGESIGVELACGAETVLRFSGGFRLLIDSPVETDCAVDLLSGTVDALTDLPVEVTAGDVTLGVEGTQFSLSLTRGEEGPDHDLSVYEGRVRVRTRSIDEEVGTGRSWKRARGQAVSGEISAARAERSAALFARLEVAKSVAAGERFEDRELTYNELRRLHLQVLTRPTDTNSRVELARAQLRYRRDDRAAYHLRRANVTTEEQLETYRLDKRILSRLVRAGVPGRQLGAVAVGGLEPIRPTPVEQDPVILIQNGDYDAAIEILERRSGDEATSEVFYGLARAYAGRDGAASVGARTAAGRALTLHQSDGKLPAAAVQWCRRVRAGSGS